MVSVLWYGMMGMVFITIIIIIITIADFHRLDPRRSVTDFAQVLEAQGIVPRLVAIKQE